MVFSYWTFLPINVAIGSLVLVDTGVVSDKETQIWVEVGEAMVENNQSALKKFWQTIQSLRRGSQCSPNPIYSGDEELSTSIGDTVRWGKKYFKDIPNPPDMPSIEEEEPEDSEGNSSITQAQLTEVVSMIIGGRAPGVDAICPEYLKSMDAVGLSWQTFHCSMNANCQSGTTGPRVLCGPEERIRLCPSCHCEGTAPGALYKGHVVCSVETFAVNCEVA